MKAPHDACRRLINLNVQGKGRDVFQVFKLVFFQVFKLIKLLS
jgi:hypothetical protein